MSLTEKMFDHRKPACALRSPCRASAEKAYLDSLFATDWEVFVIRYDPEKGGYRTFTLCCEEAEPMRN